MELTVLMLAVHMAVVLNQFSKVLAIMSMEISVDHRNWEVHQTLLAANPAQISVAAVLEAALDSVQLVLIQARSTHQIQTTTKKH